ncbi:Lrp/AsnC family transcriptional regulator [Leifsonia sp. L25]|uniref:Lrp/AsnC family transcriptional regulator n=1 Tax=Leifsonia sp. L25 TaxID=3423957 RepID=UPI003D68BCCC
MTAASPSPNSPARSTCRTVLWPNASAGWRRRASSRDTAPSSILDRLGYGILAFLRLRYPSSQYKPLHDLLADIPEVVEAHHVTGDDCFILKVVATSMRHLEQVSGRVGTLGSVTTSVSYSSPFPDAAHRAAPDIEDRPFGLEFRDVEVWARALSSPARIFPTECSRERKEPGSAACDYSV